MHKHTITLESYPNPGKAILAQDAKVAWLVDRAIRHHHLRFAWCMESTPYHEEGADISIYFLDATVHYSLTNMPKNSSMAILLVKAKPGLIKKHHTRAALMVSALVPACPYVTSAAIIMSQSGAFG